MSISNRVLLLIGAATFGGLAMLSSVPASAQGRPVVQPLPPAASADLSRALRRLASNPRDVDALIMAGDASLVLEDIDAAIGFFGRAEELSPNNPRVKAGTAAAYVRERRPVEALRLFDEAERAGVRPAAVAGDKGLAHDLVGNNLEAQLAYRRALAFEDDDEIRRRMALSYAIAGDSEGFESTLLPLLNERDFAAYRTRAFGLAILGKPDEAVAIANAVMPKEMADRIEPFLRYMRRLTPAQQAAAGNLGIFPRASAIGRDDPRIAAARGVGSSAAIAGVDSGLAPSGRPLGQASQNAGRPAAQPSAQSSAQASDGRPTAAQRQALRSQQRERGRLQRSGDRRVRVAQAPRTQAPPTQSAPTESAPAQTSPTQNVPAQPTSAQSTPAQSTPALAQRAPATPAEVPINRTERGELPALARADDPATDSAAAAPASTPIPAATAVPAQTANASAVQEVTQPPFGAASATSQIPQPIAEVAVAASTGVAEASSAPPTSRPVTIASLETGPQTATPAPGFDLADVTPPSPAESVPANTATIPVQIAASAQPAPSPQAAPAPQPAPVESVSQAFADLMALPEPAGAAPANAVDITAIEIPREVAEPEPASEAAAPKPPANASRIWVQVATGRDRDALKFDWRRFSRQAADVLGENGPYVVSWGETNRLLAGPYASTSAANAAVTALAAKGIGAFRFTSAAGQAIDRLGN